MLPSLTFKANYDFFSHLYYTHINMKYAKRIAYFFLYKASGLESFDLNCSMDWLSFMKATFTHQSLYISEFLFKFDCI
jgi:hypothetical protein